MAVSASSAFPVLVGEPGLRPARLRVQCWPLDPRLPWVPSRLRPTVAVGEVAVRSDVLRILRLGPGEWQVIGDVLAVDALAGELSAAGLAPGAAGTVPDAAGTVPGDDPGNATVSVTVVTDAWQSLSVSGRAARDVLAKGCSIDLHPLRFGVRRATRTRLAGIAAVLECADALDRFALHVASSYRDYLKSWLDDAVLEYGF